MLVLGLLLQTPQAFADGKVFPEHVDQVIDIPNQQAFIQFVNGVERLVIETSFSGSGTNFAWVVPLPSPPQITEVSEDFFVEVQKSFTPTLHHDIHHYYAGVILVLGIGFLGLRSLKADAPWFKDLPVCVLLSAVAAALGHHFVVGIIFLLFALYLRIFARSATNVAYSVLAGLAIIFYATLMSAEVKSQIQTLGADEESHRTAEIEHVSVVSVQHAGAFKSTTIQSTDPAALELWLTKNGFAMTPEARPVVRRYVEKGWVFVTSKIYHPNQNPALTTLHPLAFTFAAPSPIYPMALTGTASKELRIDLFVVGKGRASAPHFRAVRCDRVVGPGETRELGSTALRLGEALALAADSQIGTKLSATLTPKQMSSDVQISWRPYWKKNAVVYSTQGAYIFVLNITVPLVLIGWFVIGACRNGKLFGSREIALWRLWLISGAAALAVVIFIWLPKVEVIIH